MNKKLIKHAETMKGIISINSKGAGFVAPLEADQKVNKKRLKDDDLMIQPEMLGTAFHGDEVEAEIIGKNRYGRNEGKITEITKRARTKFVGTLESAKNENNAENAPLKNSSSNFFLVADDKRVYVDIFVETGKDEKNKLIEQKAKEGYKAQIEIIDWKGENGHPTGHILEVLGKKGDNNVEMHSIVLEKGFEIGFPDEVIAEANALEKSEKPIKEKEISERRDMRNVTTFTIDPVDAKDFDDAISYRELGWNEDHKCEIIEIGVHIADVSHYVRPGTALDTEAHKRAFSVYLVDRTIPMLPEVLSNDLCSLNPHEDKLAYSSIFEIKKPTNNHHPLEIVSKWFGRTVINSDRRFSYEDAQGVIDAKQGDFVKELLALNDISQNLRKEKFDKGAIDFETSEVKFRLDETGRPIEVYKKERLETHKLVEEYMLLANREVAEYIYKATEDKQGAAGIYRIHDVPQEEKIAELAIFLKAMGYDITLTKGTISSKEINLLLKKIEGKAEEALIKTATIRSMAKAIYSPVNIGHFGLAFTFYTHFTSPIRRYADLLVHRILQNHLTGGKISQDEFAKYKRIAEQCSAQEIKAAEAERTSIKLKQVEYMSERVGQIFEGTISGVTEWGMYVEEKNTRCEGMVRLRDMSGDYFSLDEKKYAIVGEKTKKVYSLGDSVRFKVLSADIERKSLDYVLVD